MDGVLLIHGFTGNRGEVAPLAQYLSERGFRTAMPCLTGHESSRKQLAAATYRDWIADVTASYGALASECDSVAVVGFSMGGLLAVQLYQTHPFCRLVTVNTPVYYWNFLQMAKNLRTDFRTHWRKYFCPDMPIPLRTLCTFQRLLSVTKPLFRKVDCPALVIQVQDDDTVHPYSGKHLLNVLPNPDKRLYRPESGGHILLQSASFPVVARQICSFLQRQT